LQSPGAGRKAFSPYLLSVLTPSIVSLRRSAWKGKSGCSGRERYAA